RDEERDEIGSQLKTPGSCVRAAAIELVEDRPHLSRDRGETAQELSLERKAESACGYHGGEPLDPVEYATRDAVPRRHCFREIRAAELPRAERAEIDPLRARDPVGERDRGQNVGHHDGGRVDHRWLEYGRGPAGHHRRAESALVR